MSLLEMHVAAVYHCSQQLQENKYKNNWIKIWKVKGVKISNQYGLISVRTLNVLLKKYFSNIKYQESKKDMKYQESKKYYTMNRTKIW